MYWSTWSGAHTFVSLYEAKTKLSSFVDRAAASEEIVIAKNGVPCARLVPNCLTRTKPYAGECDAGRIHRA